MKNYLPTLLCTLLFLQFGYSAKAQKAYKNGLITINVDIKGQTVTSKQYFSQDSAAYEFSAGPAVLKFLSDAKEQFFAILVDVPAANLKKAGLATPAEIEQTMDAFPKFSYAPSSEKKKISGFNCKKVVATDSKHGNKTYDVWITNDISVPKTAVPKYYEGIGGFPVQYVSIQSGLAAPCTVVSITDTKAPAGTFSIPSSFDKVTMDELKAMQPHK